MKRTKADKEELSKLIKEQWKDKNNIHETKEKKIKPKKRKIWR